MHLKILVNDTTELELTDVNFGKAAAIITLSTQDTETLKTLVSLLDSAGSPSSLMSSKKPQRTNSSPSSHKPKKRKRMSHMTVSQASEAVRLLVEGKLNHRQIATRVKIGIMALQQISYGASWQWLSGFSDSADRVSAAGVWDDPKWTGWNHKTVQPGPEALARMSAKGKRGINPFM